MMHNISIRIFIEDSFGNKLTNLESVKFFHETKISKNNILFISGGLEIKNLDGIIYQTRCTVENFDVLFFLLGTWGACMKTMSNKIKPINHLDVDWSTSQLIESDDSFLSFYEEKERVSLRYMEDELIICRSGEWIQFVNKALEDYFEMIKAFYGNDGEFRESHFYEYYSIWKSSNSIG